MRIGIGIVTFLTLWGVPAFGGDISIRLSVKLVLDADGHLPSIGRLKTHDDIRQEVTIANRILDHARRGYAFDLVEILELRDAPEWFDSDASFPNMLMLEAAAEADPERFAWSLSAANVYVTGHLGGLGGISAKPGAGGDITMVTQRVTRGVLVHELGHHLNLCHTQGCFCGGCDGYPVIEGFLNVLGCNDPGNDEVADTLPDVECWDRDDIARFTFSRDFDELNAGESGLVMTTFENVMSYHVAVSRFTPDQLDRMTEAANGDRRREVTGQTVFVDSHAAPVVSTPEGSGPFDTIGQALGTAGSGDVVLIRGGTYHLATMLRQPVTLRATRGDAVIR